MLNSDRCDELGVWTTEDLLYISQDVRCDICEKYIDKNLSPTNPVCEGRWCEEALEYWLDEEEC